MSWKSILQSVAPVIGTALGGPMAGMAIKAAGAALFGDDVVDDPAALEKQIERAVSTDPEALLKLKQADQQFAQKLKELDIDLERINAGDRADARAMAKDKGLLPQTIIATVFILGFVAVLYAVFSGSIQMTDDQSRIAMYLLGILSAGIMQIMNFFYGSSSGSKDKTAALSSMKQGAR